LKRVIVIEPPDENPSLTELLPRTVYEPVESVPPDARLLAHVARLRPDEIVVDPRCDQAAVARTLRLLESATGFARINRYPQGDLERMIRLSNARDGLTAATARLRHITNTTEQPLETSRHDQAVSERVDTGPRGSSIDELRLVADRLRDANRASRPEVVVVAASTGGVESFYAFMSGLGRGTPVVLVLHGMDGVQDHVADRLNMRHGFRAIVATGPTPVDRYDVVLAPSDRHVRLERRESRLFCVPAKGESIHGLRSSADPLFLSAAEVVGARSVAVVLSGMGHDALEGARAVTGAGGRVVAEDPKQAVAAGMPAAVIAAGLTRHVAHPKSLGTWLASRIRA
jgi:two-component system chemotaxis response regulator CheB